MDSESPAFLKKKSEHNDFDTNAVNKPKDKYYIVYIIFVFIGIGVLLPWNFFITASRYFQYQLRNTSLPPDVDPLLPEYRTQTQKLFTNNLALCAMIPLALTNFPNLILKDYVSAFARLVFSGILVLVMFSVTALLTKIETDTSLFFGITLASVVLINVGSSINQGSVFGILSVLPSSIAGGFLQGQGLAGITASIANIITIAVSSDARNVGFVYFLIAVFIIILSIVLFFVLFKNDYFMFYWNKNSSKQDLNSTFEIEKEKPAKLKLTFINLFKTMWEVRWTGFVMLSVFTVSLTIFPSMVLLTVPNNFDANDDWQSKYFHAVVVFLSFNVCDYLGRMAVSFVKWPTFNQKGLLVVLSILRVVFVPLTFFCNLQPRLTPVFFYHDAVPIIIVILVGLTNGYFVSLAIIYAPRYASPGNQESCGIATSTYLSLGLCFGVAISYGVVAIL